MTDIPNIKRNEEEKFKSEDYLDYLTKNKISLRKAKNNLEIQRKRKYKLLYMNDDNINISKEYQFHILKFDTSFNTIALYLNSNNPDLISYCLKEICYYFLANCPNINEQKKIIESNFLMMLLYFGKKSLEQNNQFNLYYILDILNNIQIIEEGNIEFCRQLFSYDFLDFYNNCLLKANKSNNDKYSSSIYKQITKILNNLINNDLSGTDDINFLFLRSDFFPLILEKFQEENIKEIEDVESTIMLIASIVNIEDSSKFTNNDKKIIEVCLNILIEEAFSTSNEKILAWIFRGISYISIYDEFNIKIIEGGITLKILRMKFNKIKCTDNYLKIIRYAMMILANNLTCTDKACQIFYDQNIIDYYNNILEKFDDDSYIVKYILIGLLNISIGSKSDLVKQSIIWNEKNIQKYLNYDDDIKHEIIKIIKYLLYKKVEERIKFIFNTKILEYLIFIFANGNIGKFICFKILSVIDYYLDLFKIDAKGAQEYLIIYNKFKDLFNSSEKIILLSEEGTKNNIISDIQKKIDNNYK